MSANLLANPKAIMKMLKMIKIKEQEQGKRRTKNFRPLDGFPEEVVIAIKETRERESTRCWRCSDLNVAATTHSWTVLCKRGCVSG